MKAGKVVVEYRRRSLKRFEEVLDMGIWRRLLSIGKFLIYCCLGLLGFLFFLVVSVYLYENRSPDYQKLSEDEIGRYINSLSNSGRTPKDYVLSKFGDHPIVILGEPHRVREHYEFLISLLAPLQKTGVEHLGLEFFLISSQDKIDKLLSADKFDPRLAREIVLLPNILFYYQELYDLLERAWALNQHGDRLRIIGLADYDIERRLRNTDFRMAKIANEIVEQGNKLLIYCGSHHAFTQYSQPGLNFWRRPTRRDRMGNYLYDHFKKKPFFINFHYPAFKRFRFVPISLYRKGFVLPFSGILDQIFQRFATPVGFDADLPGFEFVVESFSYYAQGYGAIRLKDFCDGYLYLTSINEYHSVRPLEDIAATEEEQKFIQSILDKRFRYLFENEETAKSFLRTEGVLPEEVWEDLDLRGLEGLF